MNTSVVEIKQYDHLATPTTKYFREPVNPSSKNYKIPIKIDAQVNLSSVNRRVYLPSGDDIEVEGYLVIEKSDLDDLGVELKPGDLIIKIGSKVVEYRIVSVNEDSELMKFNDYAEPMLVEVAFVNNKVKIGGVY
jgi:hypothetical protein